MSQLQEVPKRIQQGLLAILDRGIATYTLVAEQDTARRDQAFREGSGLKVLCYDLTLSHAANIRGFLVVQKGLLSGNRKEINSGIREIGSNFYRDLRRL